jgi:uncharacterized protein
LNPDKGGRRNIKRPVSPRGGTGKSVGSRPNVVLRGIIYEMAFDENSLKRLQAVLDEHTRWPSRYVFKFIVPQAKLAALMVIFDGSQYSLRDSKNGNYVGFTAEMEVPSSEAVADVYRKAAKIEGIIAL